MSPHGKCHAGMLFLQEGETSAEKCMEILMHAIKKLTIKMEIFH